MADTSLIAAFFAGAVSFLSPCVLPLLPGYLSLMSGYSTAELAEGNVSMVRVVRATLLFVLGFTLVFVLLFGAAATTIGNLLRDSAFTTAAGWVIIVMGLFVAVTAVWNPSFLLPFMKDRRKDIRPSALGAWAPPVMGMAFAFGWTPCIGPFLTAALALGANAETAGRGMVVLGFYSLGLGVPFLLSSLLLAKAFSFFNVIKRHFTAISVASGLLLAGFGVLMVTGRIIELNAWFSRVLLNLGLESLAEGGSAGIGSVIFVVALLAVIAYAVYRAYSASKKTPDETERSSVARVGQTETDD
ncbi:MAG: cytochrome c biogenesis protein CcdA [Acidimicrobiia bacterium]|nr:cytochrome c biogenesis protein CcdA [Acidimicrobiia bacterium]